MWRNQYIFFAYVLVMTEEGKAQKKEGDRCKEDYTNSLGVCLPSKKCETAEIDFQLNGIKPTFCIQSFAKTLVCCRQEQSIIYRTSGDTDDTNSATSENVANQNRTSEAQVRISERKCEEYSRGVTQTVELLPLDSVAVPTDRCNYARVELIVGGEDAKLGEFPHMAAIGWNTISGGVVFKCGGSLISDRFVLTAGHCIGATKDLEIDDLLPRVVRLGDQNLNPAADDGALPIDVPIRTMYKHPEYVAPVKYNDIALLELARAIQFSRNVRPACLWNKPDFDNHVKAIATGWGGTSEGSTAKFDALRKVSLDLINNGVCNQLLREDVNRNWKGGVIESQLCAGELKGGKDTCQGDSGGPLQVSNKGNLCIFYVVGVTSFGAKCAEVNKPAVYTRVSRYLDWIETVVWRDGI